MGGRNKSNENLKSCFVYNMKSDRWSQIADMNEERYFAACTVYEGKIVVCGGYVRRSMRTAEAYDYHEKK